MKSKNSHQAQGSGGINSFELVYIAISIATFSHTMWAAATVFEGPQPVFIPWDDNWWNSFLVNFNFYRWHFDGALIAMAVDVGMLVAARQLAAGWNWYVLTAFVIGAIASFYTQIIYSLYHTGIFNFGEGVNEWWLSSLTPLVDARVIVIPFMLPAFAVIYTFARISKEHDISTLTQQEEQRLIFVFDNRIYGPYKSEVERDVEYNLLVTKLQDRARKNNKPLLELPVKGEDFEGKVVGGTLPVPSEQKVLPAPATTTTPMVQHPARRAATEARWKAAQEQTTQRRGIVLSDPLHRDVDEQPSQPDVPAQEVQRPDNWDTMTKSQKSRWRAQQRNARNKVVEDTESREVQIELHTDYEDGQVIYEGEAGTVTVVSEDEE